jgi:hypothetical protein
MVQMSDLVGIPKNLKRRPVEYMSTIRAIDDGRRDEKMQNPQGAFYRTSGFDPRPGVFARLSYIPARHAEKSRQ